MAHFRTILIVVISCCVLGAAAEVSSAPLPDAIASLEGLQAQMIQRELNTALNAQTKVERAFVTEVLQLVQQKKITPMMVQSTYMSVMKQQSKQPLADFERILRQQAEKAGLKDVVPKLELPAKR